MKRAWLYRGFTLLFLLICITPALGTLLLGPSGAVANEAPVPVPQMKKPDGTLNTAFFSDAGDWFAKHFAFRQELITADSTWKAGVFHTSSQDSVALGQEGWLFYAETLDDYTGADTISPREAYCAARSLRIVRDWVESEGGRFVFTVAPNKITLYPAYGPNGLEPAGQTAAQLLKENLSAQGVPYADLFTAFRGQEETLYHQGDSHWTNRGAALAHDVLMEALGLEAPSAFAKAGHYESVHPGDLYVMLYPASSRFEAQFEFDEPLSFTYDTPVRAADDILIQTTGQGGGRLLMFRDSFGNALHPLMAESFSTACFTRATPYDLLGAADFDAVVLEIVERNVSRLAQGEYLVPAPAVDFTGPVSDAEAPAQAAFLPLPEHPEYTRVTGRLSQPCDDDSPIYLEAAGTYYEAFPSTAEDADFTALLPWDAQPSRVLCRCGGQWQAAWLGEA